MADNLEAVSVKWHPGFYSAAEIEFLSNKDEFEFQREYIILTESRCCLTLRLW